MTWVKIDDGAVHHEKLLAAGPDAVALWLAGLCYANRHTTDGVLARGTLMALYPSEHLPPARARKAAARLVSVGLWEEHHGGWQIRNYDRYQREAMSATRDRRRDADKAAKQEKRGARQTADPPDVGAVSESDSQPTASRQSADPNPIDGRSAEDSRAGAGARDPGPARPGPSECESGSPFGANLEKLWVAWVKSYGKARGQIAGRTHGSAQRDVCRVLTEHAAAAGVSFDDVLGVTLDAYWRDPWPRNTANRATFANLQAQLPTLLEPSGDRADPDADPADYDPATHGAPQEPKNFPAWNAYLDRKAGL